MFCMHDVKHLTPVPVVIPSPRSSQSLLSLAKIKMNTNCMKASVTQGGVTNYYSISIPLFSPSVITARIISHIHSCLILSGTASIPPGPTGRDRESHNGFTNELKNGQRQHLQQLLINLLCGRNKHKLSHFIVANGLKGHSSCFS